jgi:hypothetical protein
MIISSVYFFTVYPFECAWYITLQTQIYYYLEHEYNAHFRGDGSNFYWISLIVLFVYSVCVMLYFIFFLLFILFILSAGWITGYWIFNKKEIKKYEDILYDRD